MAERKTTEVYAPLYEKLGRIATPIVVGESELGRAITLFRFGDGGHTLLCAGIHAREWITTELVSRLAEKEGRGLRFDLIPCLNPDGAALCREGIGSVREETARRLLLAVNKSEDFSKWKANARCVDLNVNFDADWGEGKRNVTHPAPSDYIGKSAASEKETMTAVRVLASGYDLVVCYHALGEEVYWGYESNFRFYREAKRYADSLGYALKRSEGSAGGMKDWYAMHYQGLGLTVEVGKDEWGHPCPTEKLDELAKTHAGSLRLLAAMGEEIHGRIRASGDGGGAKGV